MFFKWTILVIFIVRGSVSQEEDGPYRGKYIGKLNSYHHQVSGDVYAVDEWTLLLVNFNYDGTGDDTFFWAGDSGRPGPQGFIIPDQHGKTNILERYYNEDVQLTLPEDKRLSRIKWFAIYDIGSQNAFGDVYMPDDFVAPVEQSIGPLVGESVSSLSVRVVDSSTFVIPEFRYDGSAEEAYFWAGVGPQPSARGFQLPDQDGFLDPLRAYRGEDVRLELPGGRTVGQVRWISVWDRRRQRPLATLLLPDRLDVPPAAAAVHTARSALPHCKQLHRDYQVSWEVFGNQVTFELIARLEDKEYMAFGISGSDVKSQMLGADVAVASYSRELQRGLATDYNITAIAPCVQVLGRWQGVCRDDVVGGQDSNQVLAASREGGVTRVSYRRVLKPTEPLDLEWATGRAAYVVWAVGAESPAGGPAYHRLSLRSDLALNLSASAADPHNDCFDFTLRPRPPVTPWETAQLFDPALRVFRFTVGAAGGSRGLRARRPHAHSLAWYVNGQLAPDLMMRRGLAYTLQVFGGDDPHSPTEYHPLILSTGDHPRGRVLAGLHHPRRGPPSPTAAGPLCIGRESTDGAARSSTATTATTATTFRAYNRSLSWSCAVGPPATLSVTPNSSWPDVVYYHSYTHNDMGGRILVVDRHRRRTSSRAPSRSHPAAAALALSLALLARTSHAVLR